MPNPNPKNPKCPNPAPCTRSSTPYALRPTPYALRPTPYALRPTPYAQTSLTPHHPPPIPYSYKMASQHFAQQLQKVSEECEALQKEVNEFNNIKLQLAQRDQSLLEMQSVHQSLMEENAALKRIRNIRERQVGL
jgi:hypothetical protein